METYSKPTFFNPMVGGEPKMGMKESRQQISVLNKLPSTKQSARGNKQTKTKQVEIKEGSHLRDQEVDVLTFNKPKEVEDEKKFEPVENWMSEHGLDKPTRPRQNVHFLHIDSKERQISPSMTLGERYKLDVNPFTSVSQNNELFISHANHPFQVGDKITIDGIPPVGIKLYFDPSASTPLLEFLNVSYAIGTKVYSYIKVNYPHEIPEEFKDDSYLTGLYSGIQNLTNKQTPTDAYAEQFYGNIPLTFVNQVHTFFVEKIIQEQTLTLPEVKLPYDPNWFYIELPYTYQATPGAQSTTKSYFNLNFYYINGIPINIINSKNPVDIYHQKIYQVITRISTNGYYIQLATKALVSGEFGGSNVQVNAIADYTGGYLEPNQYTINLPKAYKNIIRVRLQETEFPNVENVVKNYPDSSANNKIYWQNYDDGSYTYSISVSPGKYTPNTLIATIEDKFYGTSRKYYTSDQVNQPAQNYTNHNYIKMNMDTDSDTTTFTSYRESILYGAMEAVYYIKADGTFDIIPVDPTVPIPVNNRYPIFILVYFPYHRLTLNTTYAITQSTQPYYIPDGSVGDTFLVSGAVAFTGLPSDYINGEFEALSPNDSMLTGGKIDRDYFMYKIQTVDFAQYKTRDVTLHGGIFNIYTPNLFRLLFDKPDTLGDMLGFPNTGETIAVTKYASKITNKDAYQPDISNVLETDITTPGNAIMLSGHNYILMVCNQFPVIDAVGKVKSAFAKISLVGVPGKTVFNTFASTPKDYYEPIKEISQLSFSFYTPTGDLYDFNGLDHSFLLEITTLDDLPEGTNIDPHSGRSIN